MLNEYCWKSEWDISAVAKYSHILRHLIFQTGHRFCLLFPYSRSERQSYFPRVLRHWPSGSPLVLEGSSVPNSKTPWPLPPTGHRVRTAMEVFAFSEEEVLCPCFEDLPNSANPCKAFVGDLMALYFLIILGAKIKGLNGKCPFVLSCNHRCQRKVYLE